MRACYLRSTQSRRVRCLPESPSGLGAGKTALFDASEVQREERSIVVLGNETAPITYWMVMLPGGVLPGADVFSFGSIKKKLSGSGFQINGLIAPEVLLTLVMFRLNRVPEPESGVKSSERAETRKVLTVPGPVLRIFGKRSSCWR